MQITRIEEKSAIQENIEQVGSDYQAPLRRYYRLTKAVTEAPDHEWSNPLITYHSEIGGRRVLDYFREKRKGRIYTQKRPTKRRPKS